MMVDPVFLKIGLSVLAGSSDAGKSTFLRQLELAIDKGDEGLLRLNM